MELWSSGAIAIDLLSYCPSLHFHYLAFACVFCSIFPPDLF
jgi:hypothetical protein